MDLPAARVANEEAEAFCGRLRAWLGVEKRRKFGCAGREIRRDSLGASVVVREDGHAGGPPGCHEQRPEHLLDPVGGRRRGCAIAERLATPGFHGNAGLVLAAALAGRKPLDLLVLGGLRLRGRRGDFLHAGLFADLALDLSCERRVLLEEIARVVLALAEAVAV